MKKNGEVKNDFAYKLGCKIAWKEFCNSEANRCIYELSRRIDNALLYLKTMEETEDTYELEKILKGE